MRTQRQLSSRTSAAIAALVLAIGLAGSPPPAWAQAGTFVQRWRVQGEVGGDRGGRSTLAVTTDSVTIESVAGGYRGAVTYADRLVVEDPDGRLFIQVSDMKLALVGAPAAGGTALGGTFDGTAKLDTYRAASWDDAVAGRLQGGPTASVTYEVLGHWGAQLSGTVASGEAEYSSAIPRTSSGAALVRDPSWFGRSDASAQSFTAPVTGIVSPGGGTGSGGPKTGAYAPGGTSSGTGFLDYVRQGLSGTPARPAVAVPTELAAAAKALRDARPVGAAPLPANAVTIDLDVAGHFLDAKNRACGVTPSSSQGGLIRSAWTSARGGTPPAAAAPALLAELDALLGPQEAIDGARELRATLGAASLSSLVPALASKLIEWRAVALAVGATSGPGALKAVHAVTVAVAASRVPPGARSDGLLAEADAADAPISARDVRSFQRQKGKDAQNDPATGGVLGGALGRLERSASGRPVVVWQGADGRRRADPDEWLAYSRADGDLFWLASAGGEIALTDAGVAGWAFTRRVVHAVDPARVGRVLAVLPAGE